jgi:hypothetical protein
MKESILKYLRPEKAGQGRPKNGARPPHPTFDILANMESNGAQVFVYLVFCQDNWYVWVQAPVDGYPDKVPVVTAHRDDFVHGAQLGAMITKVQAKLPRSKIDIVGGISSWSPVITDRRREIIIAAILKATGDELAFVSSVLDIEMDKNGMNNMINLLDYCYLAIPRESLDIIAGALSLPRSVLK